MTKKDVEKIIALLNATRKEKVEPDGNAMLAWTLIFEPYDYETVKQAALQHMRTHGYFPTPDELIAHIPLPPEPPPQEEPNDDPPEWKRAKARYAVLRKLRRDAGLPETAADAKLYGMTANEVADKYDEKGLSFGAIMRDLGIERDGRPALPEG